MYNRKFENVTYTNMMKIPILYDVFDIDIDL